MIDRDDILRMAREAGLTPLLRDTQKTREALERFAALVAAAEREACACIAERAGYRSNGTPAYEHIAESIRARGAPATREERRAHDERYLRATVEHTRTGKSA